MGAASMHGNTSLVVVEDHKMVREMLCRMLMSQEGIDVVASAGTISEAESCVVDKHPDLVLVDVAMPDGSGIEWAQALKVRFPDIKVIFLTASETESTVLAAIDTGAEGYLVKSSSCEHLIEAIQSVASGECVYDPSVTGPILRRVAKDTPAGNGVTRQRLTLGLSAREMEIALLVARGLTNQEIAGAMFVSVNTVKTHLRRIFQHLGITSRRELANIQLTQSSPSKLSKN
jgi:DNA-binding NarL/FixJ family response regulator